MRNGAWIGWQRHSQVLSTRISVHNPPPLSRTPSHTLFSRFKPPVTHAVDAHGSRSRGESRTPDSGTEQQDHIKDDDSRRIFPEHAGVAGCRGLVTAEDLRIARMNGAGGRETRWQYNLHTCRASRELFWSNQVARVWSVCGDQAKRKTSWVQTPCPAGDSAGTHEYRVARVKPRPNTLGRLQNQPSHFDNVNKMSRQIQSNLSPHTPTLRSSRRRTGWRAHAQTCAPAAS